MGVGSIVLTTSTQNLTEMGGLAARMPATTGTFIVGGLASIGLVPLGSFWAMLSWGDRVWQIAPILVGILLIVNGLTAFNLTRLISLVFFGQPQPKTRRAPEVPWLMATPMVALTVLNLLVPIMLAQWHLLPDWQAVNLPVMAALVASSVVGIGAGGIIYLNDAIPKPIAFTSPTIQDLLAHDFWVEKLYRISVVLGVVQGSRLTAWIDRYVVDGLVNFVGFASLFSGESLKYTISGQSRNYLLTVLIGVVLGVTALVWTFLVAYSSAAAP
jgi:NAD(P)H-quinone oxidoreductase subunit 5